MFFAATSGFILFLGFGLLLLVPQGSCQTAILRGPNHLKQLVCYYQPASYLSVSDLPADLCTHIIFAFAVINPSGIVPANPGDVTTYQKLTSLKTQSPSLQVLVSLQQGFPSVVVDNVTTMATFAVSAVTFLRRYKLDGVDFDWEFPKPRDQQNYAQFLQIFRKVVDQEAHESGLPPLLVSMALSNAKRVVDTGYNFDVINAVTDFVTVMAYDFHVYSKGDNTTGLNSPLFPASGESSLFSSSGLLKYYLQCGLDMSKTLMGVPTYGRSYKLANPSQHGIHAPALGRGAPGPVRHITGFFAYPDSCTLLLSGATQVVDTASQSSYLYFQDVWVSYDNPDSLQLKAKWAVDNNLAGIGVWSLAHDDITGICGGSLFPLISALKNTLA